MKLKDAINYVDVLIEEAKEDDGTLYLDHFDIEALEMILSLARSEQMEREAGAEQKAWEEEHDCDNCKYENLEYNEEPCNSCGELTNDKWERRE